MNFTTGTARYPLGGGLVALRSSDGARLWTRILDLGLKGAPVGPVATTPDLVLAGTAGGTLLAFDYAGKLRWRHVTGASMFGGAAIVGGTIYVGSGSGNDGFGVRGRRLYAFSVDGK